MKIVSSDPNMNPDYSMTSALICALYNGVFGNYLLGYRKNDFENIPTYSVLFSCTGQTLT